MSDVAKAIQVLQAAGAVFSFPPSRVRSLCVAQVCERLQVSRRWITEHLQEFPHAYRLPGGGQNGGELRIPERDLEAFEHRQRVVTS